MSSRTERQRFIVTLMPTVPAVGPKSHGSGLFIACFVSWLASEHFRSVLSALLLVSRVVGRLVYRATAGSEPRALLRSKRSLPLLDHVGRVLTHRSGVQLMNHVA